ncbi:hypothetical protein HDV00_001196, partial [Rhizophlyctis rosea]
SELEMKAEAPIKLILDSDFTPGDVIGSTMVFDYSETDFKVTDDGKFESIDPTLKGIGAINIFDGSDADALADFLDTDLKLPKLQ